MRIRGTTRVYLVLGDPVAQVRAPELYNHLFEQHGIDAVLVPAQVAPAALPGFVRHVLQAGNIEGLWLTIPHKAAIVEHLDRVDPLAGIAGAVNAVRRRPDGTLEGALFDGIGFVKALDRFEVPVHGRRVLLVGVGGAGMAIAASLAARGPAQLALFDATPGRAEAVAARLRAHVAADVVAAPDADPSQSDVIVNATPLGLRPDDPLPFDVARVKRDAAVVDILMKHAPTPLLQACGARGVRAWSGHEMLVQQTPEYLRFFGFDKVADAVEADASEVRTLLQPDATS